MEAHPQIINLSFKHLKTEGFLSLRPIENEQLPSKEELFRIFYEELDKKQIKRGYLLNENIQQAFETFLSTAQPVEEVLIAQSKMPVHGQNAELDVKIDLTQSAGKVLEDGSLDFREINKYKVVMSHCLILVKSPPTEGMDGISVTGEEIEGKNGKDIRINIGQNVREELDEQTGCASYFATANGAVIYNPATHLLTILTEIKIEKDIDYSTGNINFPGNVYVTGFVKSGFKVTAVGNVFIGESVDNAVIESGGDINVKKGIVGNSTCTAGGAVKAKFAETSKIIAGTNVEIKESLIDCNVSAREAVKATSVKGGHVRAVTKIVVGSAGAPLQTNTELLLGISREQVAERIDKKKEKEVLEENLEKIKEAVGKINTAILDKLPEDKRASVQTLFDKKAQLAERITELEMDLENLNLIRSEAQKGYISIEKTIYPGVSLFIDREKLFINQPKTKIGFKYNKTAFKIEETAYKE